MTDQSTQDPLMQPQSEALGGPVTCLGMTFASDAERRAHFTVLLAKKLQTSEFRMIEGFLEGEDASVLAMSDPPFFTVCPNPFIPEAMIRAAELQKDGRQYQREPIVGDVSEGKNDPLYSFHTYHTKVPPNAIEKYILHFTEPGDWVLDGFCGTGMTGVACAKLGRNAVVSDLSPLATHISNGNCNINGLLREIAEVEAAIQIIESEWGWVYETDNCGNGRRGTIEYVVWTEWFVCSNCGSQLRFIDLLLEQGNEGRLRQFVCPQCESLQDKRTIMPYLETEYDTVVGLMRRRVKTSPWKVVSEDSRGKRVQRLAGDGDYHVFNQARANLSKVKVPVLLLPYMHMTHERNDLPGRGISYLHDFYTDRNIAVLAALWEKIHHIPLGRYIFTAVCDRHTTRRNRFIFNKHNPHGRVNGPLSNTLFVPPLQVEMNVFSILRRKLKDLRHLSTEVAEIRRNNCFISTQSCTDLSNIPDESIDYVFTDPPFGGNILYSDLNVLSEAWIGIRTARGAEAVVDEVQSKSVAEYQLIMQNCFRQYFLKLKSNRWITVVFHNSQNLIWAAIQEALNGAGFIVTDVSILDKKQGTIHQDLNSSAVEKDLVISAYKPDSDLEQIMEISHGTTEGAWAFVRTHLRQLPLPGIVNGQLTVVPERQNYLLFDRMVAFHVQRGARVPMSAAEFYVGLLQRFPQRDGMYFVSDQASEYDHIRMKAREVVQLNLIIIDEASAIQWLRQKLDQKPQTFQSLHPDFMREIGGWQKHERSLELSELLEQNFLQYEGVGDVPSQIHGYLSSNYKDLRNLGKDDPALRAAGRDRWYVPDPSKAVDLEKLREKALLKEFDEYRQDKAKLKVFRLEAARAGFRRAWQERDYATIIAVAEKIPEDVLQEDLQLMLWRDQAMTRSGQ